MYIQSEYNKFVSDALVIKDTEQNTASFSEKRDRLLGLLQEAGIEFTHDIKVICEILKNFNSPIEFVANLRSKLNLPNRIALGEVVSLAETLLTDNTIEDVPFETIFATGLLQDVMRKFLRFQDDVEPKNLTFDIENQSPDLYRSIVEVTSNAIDFSELGGSVFVEISENGFSVRDEGTGMSKQEVFEKLFPLKISGSRPQSKASIGKFGLGFLTILNNLRCDGDFVLVETSKHGRKQNVKYVLDNSRIFVEFSNQNVLHKGTRVALSSGEFDQEASAELLIDHLSHKRDIKLYLDGQQINTLDSFKIIKVGDSFESNAALIIRDEDSDGVGQIEVLVNGVMVEKIIVTGLELPKSFILDLPYITRLPESRNEIEFDNNVRQSIRLLIEKVFRSNFPFSDICKITNALAEIINRFQSRIPNLTSEDDLLLFLSDKLLERSQLEQCVLLPNQEPLNYLQLSINVAFLSDLLPCVDVLSIKEFERCRAFQGSNNIALLVDFKEEYKLPLVNYKNIIFINKGIYKPSAEVHALLNLYLNVGRDKPICKFNTISETEKPSAFKQMNYRDFIRLNIAKQFDYYSDYDVYKLILNQDFETNRYFSISRELERLIEQVVGGIISEEEFLEHVRNFQYVNETDEHDVTFEVLNVLQTNPENALENFRVAKAIRDLFTQMDDKLLDGAEWKRWKYLATGLYRLLIDNQQHFPKSVLASPEEFSSNKKYIEFICEKLYEGKSARFSQLLKKHNSNGNGGEQYIDSFESSKFAYLYTQILRTFTWLELLKRYNQVKKSNEFQEISNYLSINDLEQSIVGEDERYFYLITKCFEWNPEFMKKFYTEIILKLINLDVVSLQSIFYILLATLDPESFIRYINSGSRSAQESIIRKIKSGQDTLEAMNSRLDSYIVLGQNITKISNLPEVSNIFTFLSQEFDSLFYRHGKREQHDQLNLIQVEDINANLKDYASGFTKNKLQIINQTVRENFEPGNMTQIDQIIFIAYLKRCLKCAYLSDEDFEKAQPIFLSTGNYETFIDVYSSEDFNKHPTFRNWQTLPAHTFSKEVIAQLVDKIGDLSYQQVQDMLIFWKQLHTSELTALQNISTEEKLNRVLNIWMDLSKKPKVVYDRILKKIKSEPYIKLKRSFQPRWYSYGYFLGDMELNEIPELIRPYVIYLTSKNSDIEWKDKSLQQIESVEYNHSILLSQLGLAKKLRSREFHSALDDKENFGNWVKEVSVNKNPKILQRELIHAIFHQSVSDPNLYMRELIQNSYDATLNSGDEDMFHSIEIDEAVEDSKYVIQFSDEVGMNFETVMTYLLIPGLSSKNNGANIGKFGVGFLSIFKDAKEVLIRTGRDGQRIDLKVSPHFDESGQIDDLIIEYSIVADMEFKGTVIQKVLDNDNFTDLHSAYLQTSVIKYGSYIDSSQLSIFFNHNYLNHHGETITELSIDSLGSIKSLRGKGNCITQGGIYVMELPVWATEKIPFDVAEMLISEDLVIDIPKSIPLTRSRNDIAKKQLYIPILNEVIPVLAIRSFLRRFVDGEINFDLIPYDYFWQEGTPANSSRSVSQKVLRDAERINNGEIPEDLEIYLSDNSGRIHLLELLITINCLDYRDEKISLNELAKLVDKEEVNEEDLKYLPDRVVEFIKEAWQRKENVETQKAELKEKHKSEVEIRDIPISGSKVEQLRKNADVYLAFLDLVKKLTNKDIRNQVVDNFYYKADGSIAHAYAGQPIRGWNILAIESSYISEVISALKNNRSLNNSFIEDFLNTLTHEEAHILSEIPHWGVHHNSIFYSQQRKVIADLLFEKIDLEKILTDLRDSYSGSSIPGLEMMLSLAEA